MAIGTVWGQNTWGANTWGASTWGDAAEPPPPPDTTQPVYRGSVSHGAGRYYWLLFLALLLTR